MCVCAFSVTLPNTEKEEGKEKTQKAGGETRKRRKRKGKGGREKKGYILNVYLCKNTYPICFLNQSIPLTTTTPTTGTKT